MRYVNGRYVVRIADLRRNHPDWTWRAERHGFAGYIYHGTKGDRTVEIQAFAQSTMIGDDDFYTVWYVREGGESVGYGYWSMRNDRSVQAASAT